MTVVVDLSTLGLSADQRSSRRFYLGGSDANTIMSGDVERIIRLWQEKRGEVEPEDLSDVLQVQLGAYTEAFNRAWFERRTGRAVTHVGEERASLDRDWMGATLDGMTDGETTVWEAKHVSAFAKPDEVLAKYLPQLTHNMLVTGVRRAVLSVLYGNHKFETFDVELDEAYAEALIMAEEAFWACVLTGAPPAVIEVAAPVPAVRTADMTGNNAWSAAAADWVANKAAAKAFDDAAKALKALVEPDVAVAEGHGVTVKRTKAGALNITQTKGAK